MQHRSVDPEEEEEEEAQPGQPDEPAEEGHLTAHGTRDHEGGDPEESENHRQRETHLDHQEAEHNQEGIAKTSETS